MRKCIFNNAFLQSGLIVKTERYYKISNRLKFDKRSDELF